jgi:hypothetical protein
MHIFADTHGGHIAAEAYARLSGVAVGTFIRNSFGEAMTARNFAVHVAMILTDPVFETGLVYGLKPGESIVLLDS